MSEIVSVLWKFCIISWLNVVRVHYCRQQRKII